MRASCSKLMLVNRSSCAACALHAAACSTGPSDAEPVHFTDHATSKSQVGGHLRRDRSWCSRSLCAHVTHMINQQVALRCGGCHVCIGKL